MTEARTRRNKNVFDNNLHGINAAIANLEGVLKEPAPDVLVMELAGSTVNIRVRRWLNPPRRAEALDTRDKVLTRMAKFHLLAYRIYFTMQEPMIYVEPPVTI